MVILDELYNVIVIFAGDFNCIPNSGIYKFITEGKLNCSTIDYKKVNHKNKIRFQDKIMVYFKIMIYSTIRNFLNQVY